MNSLVDRYIEDSKNKFNEKNIKNKLFSQKILFKRKNENKAFTLSEIEDYKSKVYNAQVQSEIFSISKIMENKVVFFQTATINPSLNITSTDRTFPLIDNKIKEQYECFKKFHRYRKQFKFNNKKQDFKFIRVYELTKACNLHSHNIDILSNTSKIEHYLKSIIHRRKSNQIARVELAITKPIFQYVKELFSNGFTIRVNNRYIQLKLIKKHGLYTIENINEMGKGNFIYFKILNQEPKTQKNITKYVFKYLLKSKTPNKISKEMAIFSKLKIRRCQYSLDFFSCGIRKDILYRTSSKLYNIVYKYKNEDIRLRPKTEQKKCFIFYTAKLFKRTTLFKIRNCIYYRKNFKSDAKWVEVLDTKKYSVEVFKDRFSDTQTYCEKSKINENMTDNDYVKMVNDFIRSIYYYTGLENSDNIDLYDYEFVKEKPYLKDLYSIQELKWDREQESRNNKNKISIIEKKIFKNMTFNKNKIKIFNNF
ncbi:hypothetical protein ACH5BK_06025 [Arcobacter sp. YIC-80]|uniref:hypothetical protein n=1 Tax=Arcobacter sp. YIC-80 TaxID=3376683 RepID=UPI003850B23E